VPPLTDWQAALLGSARRAVLATTRPDGRPRLVPIAYAFDDGRGTPLIYSALDEKPKLVSDPHLLARVRDVVARSQVSLLVDRWTEDWARLAWLRLDGRARVVEPGAEGHARAVALLRERYPQYAAQRLEDRPLLVIEVESVTGWRP
jgi:PPOX class probable F420-dependent enzyme